MSFHALILQVSRRVSSFILVPAQYYLVTNMPCHKGIKRLGLKKKKKLKWKKKKSNRSGWGHLPPQAGLAMCKPFLRCSSNPHLGSVQGWWYPAFQRWNILAGDKIFTNACSKFPIIPLNPIIFVLLSLDMKKRLLSLLQRFHLSTVNASPFRLLSCGLNRSQVERLP